VPILNDAIREEGESFEVRLSNPTGPTSLGAQTNAGVAIQDNDPGVSFRESVYPQGETAGFARVEVLRGSDGDETVSVDCRVTGGTATAGLDYLPALWTITFVSGESAKTIELWIVNDGLVEGEETVELTLTNVVGGPGLGDPATTILRIVDDEVPAVLDPTFDPGEAVDLVRAVVQQPNGRLLAGGNSGLVGFLTDGSQDPSFHRSSFDGEVWSVVLTAENKVLVGGGFGSVDGVNRPGLVRMHEDGTVDLTFAPAAGGRFMKLDPAGRILIYEDCDNGAWLKRLNSDGSLDTGFTVDPNVLGCLRAAAVLTDGKVLIEGGGLLARLNADGSLDAGFSVPQLEATDSEGESVRVIEVLEEGRVLIAGRFTHVDGLARGGIARLNADGTVDSSFDTGSGLRIETEDGASQPATVFCVLPLPGGRVLVAGDFTRVRGVTRHHLAVLEPDGSVGPEYEFLAMEGTWVWSPWRPRYLPPTVNSIVSQRDGRIIIGGEFTAVNGRSRRNLARLYSLEVTTAFEFSELRHVVGEGEGLVTVRVRRVGESSNAASVRVGFGAGTGTLGADCLGQSGVLHFAPLQVEQEFPVAIIDDGWEEMDETIELTLSEGIGAVVVGTPSMQLVIVDNDRPGSLDTTFAGPFRSISDPWYGGVYRLLVQPDGRVLVRGDLPLGMDPLSGDLTCGLVRLNRDGSLDSSFTPPADASEILTVLPDGRFIARRETQLVRLRPDGSRELGFAVPADWSVNQIVAQPDGRLVLVGSYSVRGTSYARVRRLAADGTTDGSFQEPAFQGTAGSCWVGSATVIGDGRILVGGEFCRVNGEARWNVVRLRSDGTVDPGFVMPDLGEGSVSALLAQRDGKVVAGGWFSVMNGAAATMSIVRFNADGALDTAFLQGVGAQDEGGGRASVWTVLQQRDGKLVVAGDFRRFHGAARYGLARLNSDGTLDRTFDLGVQPHFVYPDGNVEINSLSAVALLPSGQIVVGGRFNEWSGLRPLLVARINGEFLTRFIAPARLPDGVFEFGLHVQAGETYVLEASSDLSAWAPVSTNTAAANELWFNALNAPANRQMFFRAVSGP